MSQEQADSLKTASKINLWNQKQGELRTTMNESGDETKATGEVGVVGVILASTDVRLE